MKVYLAAAFSQQKRVRLLIEQLEQLGINCTNSWQDEHPHEDERACAERDLKGVDCADWLVVLTDKPSTTGGYHFEMGYAYKSGKPILVVGPRHGVFPFLKEIARVKEWKKAKEFLVKVKSTTVGSAV